MKGPPLGPGGEDISCSPGAERRLVPAKSNLKPQTSTLRAFSTLLYHPVSLAEVKKKPRKRRTARCNKAKSHLFRPRKPPQKFYASVWRGRKI